MNPIRSSVDQWRQSRAPGTCLDISGVAAVRRADNTIILVEVPEDTEVCHFCALVAPLPEGLREAALLAALEMNRFGRPLAGCWLAWEPEVEMLSLCHNLHVPSSDAIALANTLDNFVSVLDATRGLFVADEPAAPGILSGRADETTAMLRA